MTPVDFETLSGSGLHAHIGTLGLRVAPQRVQVLFQNAQTTREALRPKSLCDDHGAGFRILLQQLGDGGFKRVQFAGALPRGGRACRRGQVLSDGSASDVKMTRDLARRPVFDEVEAMNRVDLFAVQHVASSQV